MDQSPGPERRIKRAPPKRARVVPAEAPKDEKNAKENKAPGQEDNDVDLGVLLGRSSTFEIGEYLFTFLLQLASLLNLFFLF